MNPKICLLLVEDNPGDIRLIMEMLKETKKVEFAITNSARLDESLKLLDEKQFKVILLDLGLPDSQGLDTFKKVRSHAPGLPVVILTGLDDESVALQAIKAGAQDYLTKSEMNSDNLVRILQYAIERKQAEGELKTSSLATETSMNAIFAADLKGIITYANTSASKMWGYKCTEEMIGTNAIEYWTESTQGKAGEMIGTLLKEGNVATSGVLIGKRLDGTEFVVESNSVIMKDENGKPVGLIGSFSDITDRKKAEQRVKERIKELEILYSLDKIAGKKGFTLDKLYQELVGILPQGCQYPEIACTRIVIGDSEFRTNNFAESAWMQSAPVKVSGTVVGKIEVGYLEEMPKEGEGSFLKEEKQLIDSIAERLGQITQRRQAEDALQQTLKSLRKAVSSTIQVIVSTLEARDPYTAGHQIRVADLTRAIATEMKFSKDRIEGVFMAASIHDIGKLSVPAEILSKPGKLTETEFSLIKEHSKKSYEILKNVESPWPLAEIVYQHHERMDGSGYPRNLKGDAILMEACIMAVADVVEAMASHRPYRPALGVDAALEEIEDNKGTLYDAHVVDVCLRLFREKGYQLQS